MQLLEKEKATTRRRNRGAYVLRISSSGLVSTLGKPGILKMMPARIEKRTEQRIKEFSTWCMPEQQVGYIKCKKYDFF